MAEKEFRAVGRRKTAIAIVKLTKGKGRVFINNKTLKAYLGERASFEMMIYQPLALTNNETAFDVKVKALGGGVSAQAAAIRHGIAKALLEVNPENKSILKLYEINLTRLFIMHNKHLKNRGFYGNKRRYVHL